jgi:ABC transport system ATP-binding/permease protein
VVPAVPTILLPQAGQQLTIGRAHGGGVWNHPQVSRDHASIDGRPDGSHVLRDLGSTNGTYVNGQRIQSQALQRGDVVQIGPFKLSYTGVALAQQDMRTSIRLEARGLSVTRPDPGAGFVARFLGALRLRHSPTKTILHQVSLCIEPGDFVALVGTSGAGKSTLMGALSGFSRASAGTVHINGDDYYQNFDAYRPSLGYVPQDDIVHRPLPVSRALGYSALLRLPSDLSAADVAQRVDSVLGDVEMSTHRTKRVENLSGGQRKRVSIASELLADPSLFFLDEPTSGLDPGLEKKMMYTLRQLADRGRTIVLVTHATANIDQCSHVAFLAGGRLAYYGPPGGACAFFGVQTGDFADIYTRLDGQFDSAAPPYSRPQAFDIYRAEWQRQHPGGGEPLMAELWERHYRQSDLYRTLIEARLTQPAAQTRMHGAQTSARSTPPAHAGVAWRQLRLLAHRYLDLTVQDQRNLAILLTQAPLIAMLLAFVAKEQAVRGAEATYASARPVLFMLATVAVWFGIINAAREVTKEAAIYRRERLAGLRILPYVLSKVAVLMLLVVIQSAVLLAIVGAKVTMPEYGLIGTIWLDLFVTTFLASLGGLALGLAISTFASTPDRAISLVPLALIPQIVLSDVIFPLEGNAEMLSWLAIGRWAMDAYGAIIDLNALPQFTGSPPPSPPLDQYTHEPVHLALRWLAMAAYTLVCLGITTWLLRRKDRQP